MATNSVTVRLDMAEIGQHIKRMRSQGGSIEPLFTVVHTVMMQSMAANFQAGGRPKKWAPLSGWTIAVRTARSAFGSHGLSQNTLQDSGRLRGSWTQLRHPDSFVTRTSSQLTFGTNVPYARLMQEGGTVRPKNGKYLALPFPGVSGRPRMYDGTFIRASRGGGLIIFQKVSKTEIKPLFLLKKSVKIEARPHAMFLPEDVSTITTYAAAFAFDPDGFAKLSARLKSAGGGLRR